MTEKLPEMKDWNSTREALRSSLEPLRSARLLGTEEIPNELHHSLFPHFNGARTGPLDFGGELFLDYKALKIVFKKGESLVFEVPLAGHSQRSLFDEVALEFAKYDINISPYKDKVESTEKFDTDQGRAKEYAELQFRVFNAIARFKAHLFGPQTPIALWPHGFDLSTIWFPFGSPEMNEKVNPQMNFGFSPGTSDDEGPYIYFYAWPVPDGLVGTKLPMGGEWNEAWSTPGAVFKISEFNKAENPDREMTRVLLESFWSISPRLG